MPTVLLFDDRIKKVGGVNESTLEGFAERLVESEGFEAHAPVLVDERGFGLVDASIEDVTSMVLSLIRKFHADAVIMDVDWWGDKMFGKKLWIEAKGSGLTIPDRRVVFVTQMLTREERASIVDELALDPRQVCYRNKEGFDAAVVWLNENL